LSKTDWETHDVSTLSWCQIDRQNSSSRSIYQPSPGEPVNPTTQRTLMRLFG
jgi:hypothetical protein